MKKRRRFHHNTIAIVYDFDGTLTPQPMQEYTVLPGLGIKAEKFWDQVAQEKNKTKSDRILTYMRLMVERAQSKQYTITRLKLRRLARKIRYFPGVGKFFARMNGYVAKKSKGEVHVEHFLISAGLKEILEGISIKKHFKAIFACEYHYNFQNVPTFPLNVVNDTQKTQYLFRISKGIHSLNEDINQHMPDMRRPIPFRNILYIGDGLTDVPCMTVTRKEGGLAIAVYNEHIRKTLQQCRQIWRDGRVAFVAKADYRNGSDLDARVKLILGTMIHNILLNKAHFKQHLAIERAGPKARH